ncbi:hypothetical protein PCC8801_2615 [Rippkaea orientalis PCC 8801]|uniref:Uncharacterized protein n=1 Tax=Rippkaea orientalis (strain PCC 8801 / RF-1) TaxID=41431 RepID=B7K4W3_RIPO1|nr:hypothetical protein PCC8801_2615 [Rippkaea orientalis PCC 8801]
MPDYAVILMQGLSPPIDADFRTYYHYLDITIINYRVGIAHPTDYEPTFLTISRA